MPIGANANPTGQPIGGGAQPWIAKPDNKEPLHRYDWNPIVPTVICHDYATLRAAIENADDGAVVFIEDDAEIYIENNELTINKRIVLASGRGRRYQSIESPGRAAQSRESQGAMLYATSDGGPAAITIDADGVRLTGLRVRGPHQEIMNGVRPRRVGVSVTSGRGNLEIDNCELFGWTRAAIYLDEGCRDLIHIHHNHIHNNLGAGTGYGVSLDQNCHAVIECNRFNNNRHAIAGAGGSECSYVARFNIVDGGATGHSFDMHGDVENNNGAAGRDIHIHNNTFLATETSYGWQIPAIKIRGVTRNCVIESNLFAHGTESRAVWIHPDNQEDVTRGNASRLDSVNKWWISGGQIGQVHCSTWTEIARSVFGMQDLAFGDFTGDGLTDALRTDGKTWWLSSHAREPWRPIYESKLRLNQIAIGKFVENDARSHVLWPDSSNGNWYLFTMDSTNNVTSQEKLPYGSEWPVENLRFWDIDGKDQTDIFKLQNGRGYVSWGARHQWEELGSFDGASISDLASGVFMINDNRVPGILYADGESIWIYPNGRAPRKKLMTSSFRVKDMICGDFFGLGCTCIGRKQMFDDKEKIVFSKPKGEHYEWESLDSTVTDRACKPEIAQLGVGRFRRPDKDDLFAVSHLLEELPW